MFQNVFSKNLEIQNFSRLIFFSETLSFFGPNGQNSEKWQSQNILAEIFLVGIDS